MPAMGFFDNTPSPQQWAWLVSQINQIQYTVAAHTVSISHLKAESDRIIAQGNKIMATLADIQAKSVELAAAVKAEDDVIDGAVTLITGLVASVAAVRAELAAAIANNDPVATQAALDSLTATISDINAKKQVLADAVAANTPAG